MFGPMMKNPIVFLRTEDPTYKTKRKVLSSAFMKKKQEAIKMDVKISTLRTFAELQAQGDVNEVDLGTFTSKVQANVIISILVGS